MLLVTSWKGIIESLSHGVVGKREHSTVQKDVFSLLDDRRSAKGYTSSVQRRATKYQHIFHNQANWARMGRGEGLAPAGDGGASRLKYVCSNAGLVAGGTSINLPVETQSSLLNSPSVPAPMAYSYFP